MVPNVSARLAFPGGECCDGALDTINPFIQCEPTMRVDSIVHPALAFSLH